MKNTYKPTQDGAVPADAEQIVNKVREKYGQIAKASPSIGCCGPTAEACCGPEAERVSERLGYSAQDLEKVPEDADLGLGCGAPVGYLDLRPGETVLDLGSGAGIDALLAADRVGPDGKVIGVDMTPEMIERARDNAEKAGVSHAGASRVDFREGRLEALPVADASVDAVTSNCVINLVPDKPRVFREVSRVLRPGGRLVVSDIVLDGELPDTLRNDLLAYVGCVSGAMQREEYFATVAAAGLSQIDVLSDTDIVATGREIAPEQIRNLAERAGVSVEELRGKIHSITYRAVK
jgi:SAM-dependent methyltransferase